MECRLSNGEVYDYLKKDGGEKVLLLIHGNYASANHWDVFLEKIPSKYTVYAPDLRGYGRSTYNQPIEDFKTFAYDLKLFCDHFSLNKITIIGWSNGGGIALQFAAMYPNLVEKMVLLASMPAGGYPAYDENNKRYQTREAIEKDPMLNRLVEAQKMKEFAFFTEAIEQLMFVKGRQALGERFEGYIEAAIQQRNIMDVAHAANVFNITDIDNDAAAGTGEINHIQAETFLLWGNKDVLTTREMTTTLLEDLKRAGVNVIFRELDAGHAFVIEEVDEVIRELESFFQR